MNQAGMKRLLKAVRALTAPQKAEPLAALGARNDELQVVALIEFRVGPALACPHSAGHHVVRNGHARGLQRYKCRSCLRTFNALSTTPLARLRKKDKWLAQQDVLCDGLSVSKVAVALDVATTTAFRWRRRFLKLAQAVQAADLAWVVEADETFFMRSSKRQRRGRVAHGMSPSPLNAQRALNNIRKDRRRCITLPLTKCSTTGLKLSMAALWTGADKGCGTPKSVMSGLQ